MPILLLAAERARRTSGYLLASIGVAIVSASLVLTRSRAAWLATAAMLLVLIVVAPSKRLAGVFIFAAAGVAAALLIPNALRWNSENPYLDSVRGMMNGRGRLTQYERSLIMAAKHPLLGVGAGNWAVAYPREVGRRDDPSLSDSDHGMTTNPWPSSDWIACVSERGFLALIVLVMIFIILALKRADDPPRTAALLGVLVAVAIAGAFDAVLLLALPTLLVWSSLGALAPSTESSRVPTIVVLLVIAVSLGGAIRSAAQLTSMEIYSTRNDRRSLEWASRIDPGNFRLQLRLGHTRAARELFPTSREVSRR